MSRLKKVIFNISCIFIIQRFYWFDIPEEKSCTIVGIFMLSCYMICLLGWYMMEILPKYNIKKINGLPNFNCVICMDNLPADTYIGVLLCNHQYHYSCITTWFSKNKNTCPLCRTKIYSLTDNKLDDIDLYILVDMYNY